MISIEDYFQLAELAEASYANLANNADLETQVQRQSDGMSFSQTQAAYLADRWNVVTNGHQPNTSSGFSSTLFQNKNDDSYVLAIRGTEPFAGSGADLGADVGDIVSDGLAVEQIIDLYNEWMRITTPRGGVYTAAKLEILTAETLMLTSLTGTAAHGLYLEYLKSRTDLIIDLDYQGFGPGVPIVKKVVWENSDTLFSDDRKKGLGLQAEIMDKGLTVTGHSLGGHLASAFTRLFPEVGADALTINGAGFGAIGFSLFASSNVRNLFSMLHGEPAFNSNQIHNLYGDKNSETVTQNGYWLFQPGGHESIFIEQDKFWGNTVGHGSGQMTDSLAVYDLFFRLTSNVSLNNVHAVFEGASNERKSSLEYLLNALGDIFAVGSRIINIDDREKLHAYLELIRNNPAFIALADSLTLVPATGAEARTDYGQFLSLHFAASFSLQGTEADLAQLNPALYTLWKADQSLTAAERANGQASFSDQWYEDRSAYLTALLSRNENDIDARESANSHNLSARYFAVDGVNQDRAIVYTGAANANNFASINAARIVFGDDAANAPANGVDAFIGGIVCGFQLVV
jgi:hypothetical protein